LVPFSDVALSLLVQRSSCLWEDFEAIYLDPVAVASLLAKATSLTKLTLQCLKADTYEDLLSAIGLGKLVPNLHTFKCDARGAMYYIHFLKMREKAAALPHPSCTAIRSMVVGHGGYAADWESVKKSLASKLYAPGINVSFSD
jgi:hypothetical protein